MDVLQDLKVLVKGSKLGLLLLKGN
jgi:hypothetical protein